MMSVLDIVSMSVACSEGRALDLWSTMFLFIVVLSCDRSFI